MYPIHGPDFNPFFEAVLLQFPVRLVEGGKTPPAGPGHGVGKNPVGIGLDHLGDIGIARGLDLLRVSAIRSDTRPPPRPRPRFAFDQDPAGKEIVGPQAIGPGQRNDLGFQADRFIPALFQAEGIDADLGVMDDEQVLGRLPVGGRFDIEGIIAGAFDLVSGPPGSEVPVLLRGSCLWPRSVLRAGRFFGRFAWTPNCMGLAISI